jgi:hypothetical protein
MSKRVMRSVSMSSNYGGSHSELWEALPEGSYMIGMIQIIVLAWKRWLTYTSSYMASRGAQMIRNQNTMVSSNVGRIKFGIASRQRGFRLHNEPRPPELGRHQFDEFRQQDHDGKALASRDKCTPETSKQSERFSDTSVSGGHCECVYSSSVEVIVLTPIGTGPIDRAASCAPHEGWVACCL